MTCIRAGNWARSSLLPVVTLHMGVSWLQESGDSALRDTPPLPGACEDEDALEEEVLGPGFSIDYLHGLLDTEAPAASASQEGAHELPWRGGSGPGGSGPGEAAGIKRE